MKRTLLVTLTLVLAVTLTTTAFAGTDKKDVQPTWQTEQVEANLIAGVQSNNFGLRLSEFKTAKAVFTLMGMLRNESDERGRIVAAMALIKIGDPVGLYAVKQTGRLDDNVRVRKLCALFYQEHEQEKQS
jgi:HEAT repeat protein